MTPFYIFLAIAVVAALWVVLAYNKFVRLINRAKEAWADIDVQLKRRYDLIPPTAGKILQQIERRGGM